MDEIQRRTLLAMEEILNDIEDGTVPATVRTFSQLHDYVDANEYGGLCDDDCNLDDDLLWVANAVQDLVNEWLRNGRPFADQPREEYVDKLRQRMLIPYYNA